MLDYFNFNIVNICILGDGTFSFEEFVQLMYNMGNLSEISEEQERAELRDAFKVLILLFYLLENA